MSSLEIRVCGRFKLEDKLYQGKYSTVYTGRNVQSDTDCSIKCEQKALKESFVKNEGKVLQQIQGGVGIPNLLWHGQNGDFNFLITELLGNSLQDYFQICQGKLSLKTTLMIADKILSSLEFIHYKNFVHRDIQPGNFLMGLGKKLHQIYTIDHAFSTLFMDSNGKHRPDFNPLIPNEYNVGTLKFSSLNVLRGHLHSRRDDLQSLGLILVYFLKGGLPWQNPESQASVKQRKRQIRKMMQEISLEELCNDLPKEILTYMQYCRNLKYQENPDYNYLKRLFKQKLIREGFQYDHVFDWILLPLRLKNTKLSHRIPLNRAPKKESTDPSMSNSQYNFKEDFLCVDNYLKANTNPKEDKKTVIQDSRVNRSVSTNSKPVVPNKPTKKTKDDCQIY